MNKPTKPVSDDPAADLDDPEVAAMIAEDAAFAPEADAWLARNHDAVNESIIQARKEFAEGKAEPWDMDEMLGDLRAEFEKNRQT
ncbi:MAG: hypothetical protein JWP92_2633 [Caulobacter sp.]|nr:hypothetical protein [Caulobacter sp.]